MSLVCSSLTAKTTCKKHTKLLKGNQILSEAAASHSHRRACPDTWTPQQPSAGEDVTVHLSVYIFLQQPHGTVDGYCRKRPCLVWIFIFQTRLSAHVTQTTFDLFKNHSTTNPSGPGETVGRCRHAIAKCCHFLWERGSVVLSCHWRGLAQAQAGLCHLENLPLMHQTLLMQMHNTGCNQMQMHEVSRECNLLLRINCGSTRTSWFRKSMRWGPTSFLITNILHQPGTSTLFQWVFVNKQNASQSILTVSLFAFHTVRLLSHPQRLKQR